MKKSLLQKLLLTTIATSSLIVAIPLANTSCSKKKTPPAPAIPSIAYSLSEGSLVEGVSSSNITLTITGVNNPDLSTLVLDLNGSNLASDGFGGGSTATISVGTATEGEHTIIVKCTGCSDLEIELYVDFDDSNIIGFEHLNIQSNVVIGFNGTYDTAWGTELVLPENVISVADNAFSENEYITKAVLTCITTGSIGNFAFYGCTALTNFNLSNMTTGSIGTSAFGACNSLTVSGVTLPSADFGPSGQYTIISTDNGKAVINNDKDGVVGALAVGSFTWADLNKSGAGMTVIGAGAFNDSAALISINLSAWAGSMGNNAFASCTGLTYVNISGMTTGTIGNYAFSGCGKLTVSNLILPSGSFGPAGAQYKIISVTYGKAVINNASNGIVGCLAVGRFTWPELNNSGAGMTTIADSAFKQCASLTKISSSTGPLPVFETNCFRDCTGLKEFQIESAQAPNIKANAFRGCTGLTDINFASITTDSQIGNNAFDGCIKLNSMLIGIGQQPIWSGTNIFANTSPTGTIYAFGGWYDQTTVLSYFVGKGLNSSGWSVAR